MLFELRKPFFFGLRAEPVNPDIKSHLSVIFVNLDNKDAPKGVDYMRQIPALQSRLHRYYHNRNYFQIALKAPWASWHTLTEIAIYSKASIAQFFKYRTSMKKLA
jgi:hypothetical protein